MLENIFNKPNNAIQTYAIICNKCRGTTTRQESKKEYHAECISHAGLLYDAIDYYCPHCDEFLRRDEILAKGQETVESHEK